MIEHIKTTGLKSRDIDEAVTKHHLFVGPNGSGKSSRSQAIAILLMGYVPWATKPKKKAADILDTYGSGTALAVSATISGVEFERKFTMAESGSVSQRLRVNKTKFAKDEFALELHKAGAPNMIDLGAFMDLSDAKKIDAIFRLFPPAGDVAGLTADIEKKDTELKGINKRVIGLRSTIQTLSSSRAAAELPAGTLEETQHEIEELTTEVKKIKAQIKNQEEIVKAAEEKKKADEKAATEKPSENHQIDSGVVAGSTGTPQWETIQEVEARRARDARGGAGAVPGGVKRVFVESTAGTGPDNSGDIPWGGSANTESQPTSPFADLQSVIQAFEKIGNAMESAGCTACAAVMVLKKELKKYKGKN